MTTLPPQHKSIGVKWVYKIKRTAGDNVDHYKATLVENGSDRNIGFTMMRCLLQWSDLVR